MTLQGGETESSRSTCGLVQQQRSNGTSAPRCAPAATPRRPGQARPGSRSCGPSFVSPRAGGLAAHARHRPLHEGSEGEVGGAGHARAVALPGGHHLVSRVPDLLGDLKQPRRSMELREQAEHTGMQPRAGAALPATGQQARGQQQRQRRAPRAWQICSYSAGWRSHEAWKAMRLLIVAGCGTSSRLPRPANSSASTWGRREGERGQQRGAEQVEGSAGGRMAAQSTTEAG